VTGRPPTLFGLFAARARAAPDGRLALEAAAGIAAASVLAIWRPPTWAVWCTLALGTGCFGAWGVLDRMLSDGAPGRFAAVLLAARAAAAWVGAAAGIAFLLTLFALLVGPWIS